MGGKTIAYRSCRCPQNLGLGGNRHKAETFIGEFAAAKTKSFAGVMSEQHFLWHGCTCAEFLVRE